MLLLCFRSLQFSSGAGSVFDDESSNLLDPSSPFLWVAPEEQLDQNVRGGESTQSGISHAKGGRKCTQGPNLYLGKQRIATAFLPDISSSSAFESPELTHTDCLPTMEGDDNVRIPLSIESQRMVSGQFHDIDMHLEQLSSSWKDKLSLNMGMDVDADAHRSLLIRHGDIEEHFDPSCLSVEQIWNQICNRFAIQGRSGSFSLRDVEDGCVVPASAVLTGPGSYTLELMQEPSTLAPAMIKTPPPPTTTTTTTTPTEPMKEANVAGTLRFLQEPPHGAAVWLHSKVTQKGALAGSCAAHVFNPPPRVALGGCAAGQSAAELLSTVRVSLVDACGADSSALHPGKEHISQDPISGDWSISWPEMAVVDISRKTAGFSGNQKISASELQSERGALGWFCFRVELPGLPVLWLTDRFGSRAKIVIKNERNAKLGWTQNTKGPYADHSRCVPSHIGADGQRLCCEGDGLRHLGCSDNRSNPFRCMQIKAEPID